MDFLLYHFLPTVKIKDYNVMSDGKNLFNEPIKNYLVAYENIRKISNDQEDDYTTGRLLNYHYFKNDYKIIAKRV